jgi:transcriptional regulator with XRE-family HTH domain
MTDVHPAPRTVKLGETLARLIEERNLQRNRKRICSAVGITPAALSQYINHQSKPGLDKLIALSDYFKVSLDFLVFGESPLSVPEATIDYGPLARYIDASLAETQRRVAAQTALTGRIGALIGEQIAKIAEELSSAATTSAGTLTDDQTLTLEAYSEQTVLATVNLHYDVMQLEGESVPGRFLPVVAQNIMRNRGYRFLLPPDIQDWHHVVAEFKTLLVANSVDHHTMERFCKFGVTKEPFYAGYAIYKLDELAVQREQPYLYEYLAKYIDDGHVGYVIAASTDQQSDSIMDSTHLRLARSSVDRMWQNAKKL